MMALLGLAMISTAIMVPCRGLGLRWSESAVVVFLFFVILGSIG